MKRIEYIDPKEIEAYNNLEWLHKNRYVGKTIVKGEARWWLTKKGVRLVEKRMEE